MSKSGSNVSSLIKLFENKSQAEDNSDKSTKLVAQGNGNPKNKEMFYKVAFNYEAKSDDELNLNYGDIIKV